MKERIKKVLSEEKDYCLHFDGKKVKGEEYQVVCLQSSVRQINLGVLKCTNGTSQQIYNEIKKLLDEHDAWSCIQMVVCDTTAVNTGRLNGAVVKIQREMVSKGLPSPQYIGCQHHILDTVLKHVMNFFIENHSQKPTLNYKFVDEVTEKYAALQVLYKGEIHMPESGNPGWRGDFRFMYELCMTFRSYKVFT